MLPLRGGVLFPSATVPYEIGRPKTIALAEHVAGADGPFVVVFPQRVASVDEPGAADLYEVGTLARVLAVDKQRKGTYAMVVEGMAR
ncbi:MAG TPA: LON peptidase substrate-binding domain-containing protein, partial [Polyangiaceae bacterium]